MPAQRNGNMPYAIAVVSDIHAGRGSEFPDLRTDGEPKLHAKHFSLESLASSASELLDETPRSSRFLVCPGDVSTACDSRELQQGATFLSRLADRLGVPKKNRFLVPGNHDIDWNLTRLASSDPWYDSVRQNKFNETIRTHAKDFCYPCFGKIKVRKCLNGKITFILLDSPHEDRDNSEPHCGTIGEEQYEALEAALSDCPQDSVRVVVLHHHLTALGQLHDSPDFSLLTDASSLMTLLKRHSVELVIHGHQHRAGICEVPHSRGTLVLVGAGSATAGINHLPPDTPNSIHVVRFGSREPGVVRGEVINRVLRRTHGWTSPARSVDRLSPRHPFGSMVSLETVDEWIQVAIAECRDRKFLRLDRFLGRQADGYFVCQYFFGERIERYLEMNNLSGQIEVISNDLHGSLQMQMVESQDDDN